MEKYIKECENQNIHTDLREFLSLLDAKGFTKSYDVKTYYIGDGFHAYNDFDYFECYTPEQVKQHMEDFYDEEMEDEDEEEEEE